MNITNSAHKILALDTSGTSMSVAVTQGDKLLAEISTGGIKKHAQGLMPAVDSCLRLAGLNLLDIDTIACSCGPGSFTGLRIGVSTAKGLAHGANIPGVVGVPTLDALAYNAYTPPIVPIMDARRGQVYTTMYDYIEGKHIRLREYACIHINDVMDILRLLGVRATFTGDAVRTHRGLLEEQGHTIATELIVRASNVGYEAARMLGEGGTPQSPHELVPMYVRKPQAERELASRATTDEA